VPKTKTEWWQNKISRTKQLDKENLETLKYKKLNVITIFECELKKGCIDFTFDNLIKNLKKQIK
jgi:DNA mismatch endonuclease (patch repair protein)